MLPFLGETRRKGNEKREIKRNPMPLGLARSKKGSENGGNRRKSLLFPGKLRRKGNVKRETKRNPMPLGLARSKKGSENGGNRLNPMPSPGLAKPNK